MPARPQFRKKEIAAWPEEGCAWGVMQVGIVLHQQLFNANKNKVDKNINNNNKENEEKNYIRNRGRGDRSCLAPDVCRLRSARDQCDGADRKRARGYCHRSRLRNSLSAGTLGKKSPCGSFEFVFDRRSR